MDKQNLITRIAKKDGLRAMVNTDCCECIYDPIQQAVYCQPNHKDLSSASKALDKAVGNFFDDCMAKCDGDQK